MTQEDTERRLGTIQNKCQHPGNKGWLRMKDWAVMDQWRILHTVRDYARLKCIYYRRLVTKNVHGRMPVR